MPTDLFHRAKRVCEDSESIADGESDELGAICLEAVEVIRELVLRVQKG